MICTTVERGISRITLNWGIRMDSQLYFGSGTPVSSLYTHHSLTASHFRNMKVNLLVNEINNVERGNVENVENSSYNFIGAFLSHLV